MQFGRDTHRWSCFYFELQRLHTSAAVVLVFMLQVDDHLKIGMYEYETEKDSKTKNKTEYGVKKTKKSRDSPHHTSESIQILNPFATSTRCRMEHRHNLPRQRFKALVCGCCFF